MRITNNWRYLRTQDPKQYFFRGDISAAGDLDIDLDRKLLVIGNITVKGNLTTKNEIFVMGDIKVRGDLMTASVVGAMNDIYVGGAIWSAKSVHAGQDVIAKKGISCGRTVKAGRNVISGEGINVGRSVKALCGYVSCEKRIFAGISLHQDTENYTGRVFCSEFRKGDIVLGELKIRPDKRWWKAGVCDDNGGE